MALTERQRSLVESERKKHLALAAMSNEAVIRESHLEVSEALGAAIAQDKEVGDA